MMTTPATAYLGYATLEDWLCAVDRKRPVAAMQVVVSPPRRNEPSIEEVQVRLEQFDQGVVHYCLLRAGAYMVLEGKPFGEAEERIAHAAEGLWTLVEGYLQELGLAYSRATFALPTDYPLLRGHSEALRFDSKAFRWVRVRKAAEE